jgi:hypothetical protein
MKRTQVLGQETVAFIRLEAAARIPTEAPFAVSKRLQKSIDDILVVAQVVHKVNCLFFLSGHGAGYLSRYKSTHSNGDTGYCCIRSLRRRELLRPVCLYHFDQTFGSMEIKIKRTRISSTNSGRLLRQLPRKACTSSPSSFSFLPALDLIQSSYISMLACRSEKHRNATRMLGSSERLTIAFIA